MYLPGTIQERIGDLRTSKGLTQKELADLIDVEPSRLSRIGTGKTQHISSDILIKLAKALQVSTDYILGLTTVSTPKSYDISELGLSEGAVKSLVTGAVDVQILNRLLEHKSFPYLLYMIKSYFMDTAAVGIMARNDIIDMVTATLGDFTNENPEHRAEIRRDIRLLKSQKLGEHEADTEKIKNSFLTILRDIKKDMDNGKTSGTTATTEYLQQIRDELQSIKQLPNDIQAEDVAAIVLRMVEQATTLDAESTELFSQLVKRLFTKPVEQKG